MQQSHVVSWFWQLSGTLKYKFHQEWTRNFFKSLEERKNIATNYLCPYLLAGKKRENRTEVF